MIRDAWLDSEGHPCLWLSVRVARYHGHRVLLEPY